MAARDDGEAIEAFMPLTLEKNSSQREELSDLAVELVKRAAAFQSSLPPATAEALSKLIRLANCYYSNLIEGHKTHPIDIEQALEDNYSDDPEKRDLQLEGKAHIEVQKWIDDGGLQGRPTAPNAILEIHRRFCESLPAAFLHVTSPDTGKKTPLVPGAMRESYVRIGRLVAVSPGAIPRFLKSLDEAYKRLGRIESLLAPAFAHHRFLWIHPFLDGNGRVARLMSYAMLREALDTKGVWSLARGLSVNEMEYRHHLMACDKPRSGDSDGHGTLSETALAAFARFFIQCCIRQIAFMESLMEPTRLRIRIQIWAEEEMRAGNLPPRSDVVLKALAAQGELPRADAAPALGLTGRSARRVTSALVKSGAVTSSSSRAPLKLSFPAKLAWHWMPGLFPDA